VLDALAAEPKNRALYLYPTKALAQDQARALGELAVPRVRAAIYDGDTPQERRPQIRRWANLILTNPDMLHIGVLPRHDLWADVRPLEPAAPRRRARRPCERARRGVAPALLGRAAGTADDLLHEEPQGGRARPPHGRATGGRRQGEAPRAVPRRVHPAAAPRA